jgi:hypothetical protein
MYSITELLHVMSNVISEEQTLPVEVGVTLGVVVGDVVIDGVGVWVVTGT